MKFSILPLIEFDKDEPTNNLMDWFHSIENISNRIEEISIYPSALRKIALQFFKNDSLKVYENIQQNLIENIHQQDWFLDFKTVDIQIMSELRHIQFFDSKYHDSLKDIMKHDLNESKPSQNNYQITVFGQLMNGYYYTFNHYYSDKEIDFSRYKDTGLYVGADQKMMLEQLSKKNQTELSLLEKAIQKKNLEENLEHKNKSSKFKL